MASAVAPAIRSTRTAWRGVHARTNAAPLLSASRVPRRSRLADTVRDEPARLRDQLDHIAAEGGRVVSVIWQPARQVTLEPGLPPHEVASGYVIVSEHELPEAADR
jgi:hypothetical protein